MLFLESRLATGYGIQHLSDTMADIIFHYVLDEEGDYYDTHYGIDEIEPVACGSAEMLSEQVSDCVDKIFEKLGCKPAYHPNYKGKNYYKIPLFDVLFAPLHYFSPPLSESIMCLFISQCKKVLSGL